MTTFEVSPRLYETYADKGKLQLSIGFFQRYFENNCELNGEKPIIQVHRISVDKQNCLPGSFCRVQLTDGCFGYSNVVFSRNIEHRVRSDNFRGIECPTTGGEVIAIKRMHVVPGQNVRDKVVLEIEDYDLLARGLPSIKGRPHPGNKDEMMGYRPTDPVFFEWTNPQGATNGVRTFEESFDTAPPRAAAMSINRNVAAQVVRQPSFTNVTPINMITPYVNKWKICGLCTAKDEIKTINARTGQMKVFNFELTDKDGSSIRIAGFGETAEKAYSLVQSQCGYYVSGGTIKQANKRFNSTGHDYEITLRTDSEIAPCHEVIPTPAFALKVCPLDRVPEHKDETVDVLAVVETVGPINEFTSRQGRECVKRELQLIDQSGTMATMVVWGEQARDANLDTAARQVVGAKGVQVKEYNGGFSLGVLNQTKMEFSPNLPEVAALYDWYQRERPTTEIKTVSLGTGGGASGAFARDCHAIGAAVALQLGHEQDVQQRYMDMKAMVTSVKSDVALYQSCPNTGCNKKVVQNDSEYRCEKCNGSYETFKWNYLVQMEISDMCGSIYVNMFSEAAAKFFDMDAQKLGDLRDQDPDAYNQVFESKLFKYYDFRVRAKTETYNEETRIRYQVVAVSPVPYAQYIPLLENAMEKLEAI